MEIKKKSPKRLVIDINENDHYVIKKLAVKNRVTLREWVIGALKAAAEKEHILDRIVEGTYGEDI